jgi:hypothetical protein
MLTLAKTWRVDFCPSASDDRSVLELLILIGRGLALAFRGHQELVMDNLALRQQLMAAAKRKTKRLPVRPSERLFWIALARIWPNWRVGSGNSGALIPEILAG